MERMRMFATALCTLFVTMVLLAGCADSNYDEAKRNQAEAVNGVSVQWQKEKHEFENEMNAKVAELNRELGKMEARAEAAGGKTQEALNEQVDQLEKQLHEAKNKLDGVSDATAENWEVTKTEVRNAFDDVERAFKSAAERFAETVK